MDVARRAGVHKLKVVAEAVDGNNKSHFQHCRVGIPPFKVKQPDRVVVGDMPTTGRNKSHSRKPFCVTVQLPEVTRLESLNGGLSTLQSGVAFIDSIHGYRLATLMFQNCWNSERRSRRNALLQSLGVSLTSQSIYIYMYVYNCWRKALCSLPSLSRLCKSGPVHYWSERVLDKAAVLNGAVLSCATVLFCIVLYDCLLYCWWVELSWLMVDG